MREDEPQSYLHANLYRVGFGGEVIGSGDAVVLRHERVRCSHPCPVVSEAQIRFTAFEDVHEPVIAVYIREEMYLLVDFIRQTEFEEGGYLVLYGDGVGVMKILLSVEAVSVHADQIQVP